MWIKKIHIVSIVVSPYCLYPLSPNKISSAKPVLVCTGEAVVFFLIASSSLLRGDEHRSLAN